MRQLSIVFPCVVLLLAMLNVGCASTQSFSDLDVLDASCMADAYALAPRDGLAVATPAPGGEFGTPVLPEATESKQNKRLLVYDGVVALLVENIDTSMRQVRKLVEDAGGYMQSMHDSTIVFKIPAAKFEETLTSMSALGEVTYKNIVGEDITDRMRDLGIRLKNAEQIRDRLAALLEKAEDVEDALKIETELGRVTETIELLKGQVRVLENRIAFSTLTVKLNSPLPQQTVKQSIPFPWVLALGGDMVSGSRSSSRYYGSRGWRHLRFDTPKSFAKYEETETRTRATSADGVLVKVERHDNVDGGDLTFWTTFIRQALGSRRAIHVDRVDELDIRRGKKGMVLSGRKDVGGKPYRYIVAVTCTDKHVVTYEAWGETEPLGRAEGAIRESISTIRL